MRVTYDVLLGLIESHPRIAYAVRASGLSPSQAAAATYEALQNAPEGRARDAFLSRTMRDLGIVTTGVDDFHRATEAIVEHLNGEHTRDARIQALVDGAAAQGDHSFSHARTKHLYRIAAEASLTQALNDRMRDRDAHVDRMNGTDRAPDVPEHLRHSREDAADLRAATNAAIAGAYGGRRGLQIEHDDNRSVRDTLRDAFDASAEREDARDPLNDNDLRRASNAV